MPSDASSTAAVDALLIPDRVAAALAGVSRATWWRLHAAAKTPRATRLARCVRWDRAELVAWCAARCPDRRTWEAMAAQRNGRR